MTPLKYELEVRIPNLNFVMLDGCVWDPEMYELWGGGGAPFKVNKDGSLSDRAGNNQDGSLSDRECINKEGSLSDKAGINKEGSLSSFWINIL